MVHRNAAREKPRHGHSRLHAANLASLDVRYACGQTDIQTDTFISILHSRERSNNLVYHFDALRYRISGEVDWQERRGHRRQQYSGRKSVVTTQDGRRECGAVVWAAPGRRRRQCRGGGRAPAVTNAGRDTAGVCTARRRHRHAPGEQTELPPAQAPAAQTEQRRQLQQTGQPRRRSSARRPLRYVVIP